MADLLAKQETQSLSVSRGQELTGQVISIDSKEVILDLGTKSEGVLSIKDLSPKEREDLKVGSNLKVFVTFPENESGQVVLALRKAIGKASSAVKWDKFEQALNSGRSFTGKGVEVNKGGLIVEVADVRGFLPSSQVALSQITDLEDLVGKDIAVTVIEVDPSQNRLIFSQKASISETIKEQLKKLSIGDKVSGKVAAVLPFGIFVTLDSGVEGLVHISEIAWEKIEDPGKLFKVGDSVEAEVISLDSNTNRVNLSIKQLQTDPFLEISKKFAQDDVVKGVVSKVNSTGVFLNLENGAEGLIYASKLEAGVEYQVGLKVQALVDSIDSAKRRISLVPFLKTTKGLIYK